MKQMNFTVSDRYKLHSENMSSRLYNYFEQKFCWGTGIRGR